MPSKKRRHLARVGIRETRFGPRYTFVALIVRGEEVYNLVPGPNGTPEALRWWARRLGVRIEEGGGD